MSTFLADLGVDEKKYPLYERIYLVLAACFITVLVLTNIVGVKLFAAWPYGFALTTGILTYPLTFLFTDIVSEVYGQKRADFMVVLGFFMSLMMVVIVQVSVAVPGHAVWVPFEEADRFYNSVNDYQHAWESVFALQSVLLVGSMSAYMVAQLIDNRLYHFWKRLTDGKHLWLRNNGSTMISQLFDTAIVNSILFYIGFGMEFWTGVGIMVTIYIYKVCIAMLDTPLIYLGVFAVKKMLGKQFHEEVTKPDGEKA